MRCGAQRFAGAQPCGVRIFKTPRTRYAAKPLFSLWGFCRFGVQARARGGSRRAAGPPEGGPLRRRAPWRAAGSPFCPVGLPSVARHQGSTGGGQVEPGVRPLAYLHVRGLCATAALRRAGHGPPLTLPCCPSTAQQGRKGYKPCSPHPPPPSPPSSLIISAAVSWRPSPMPTTAPSMPPSAPACGPTPHTSPPSPTLSSSVGAMPSVKAAAPSTPSLPPQRPRPWPWGPSPGPSTSRLSARHIPGPHVLGAVAGAVRHFLIQAGILA